MTPRVLLTVAAACFATSLYAADPAPTPAVPDDPTVLVVPSLPVQQKPAAKERIICRTEYEIGSFVKGKRRCGTAAEWRATSTAAQDTTMRIQDQKGVYTAP